MQARADFGSAIHGVQSAGDSDHIYDSRRAARFRHRLMVFAQALNVKPDRLADLAGQALHCYRQPDLWHYLITSAITQDFSVERVAAQHIEVYQKLVGHAGLTLTAE